MEFQQKRLATSAAFEFGEQTLRHVVQDNSGRVEFEVDYGAIPHNRRVVFDRNNWLRNVGVIWCVIGAIDIGLALAGGGSLAGHGFWILIGLGCLAFYRATWGAYTVFDTPEGSVWVVQNKQHDEIVAEIETRRRQRLINAFGRVDLENDPEREIQKIEWLVKERALTREEGDRQIAEVQSARALPGPTSDRKLH